MSLLRWIGQSKEGKESNWLANAGPYERFYGLENFGNTCYTNSVLQALYFCKPFRDCLALYSFPHSAMKMAALSQGIAKEFEPSQKELNNPDNSNISSDLLLSSLFQESPRALTEIWMGTQYESLLSRIPPEDSLNDSLLSSLKELFHNILSQKKQSGAIGPKRFITKLKSSNEIFSSTMQQDAHEMFNYLMNEIADTLLKQKSYFAGKLVEEYPQTLQNINGSNLGPKTWVHELFEGLLTNETKCRNCETTTSRDEPFLDLSIDIDQHSSLSTCLRHFSKSEVLCYNDKFFCDTCNSLQEAEKRMKIKRLPNILIVHLKRFKYQEDLGRFSKLSYRVCFTETLGLFNTVDDAENAERIYELCSIIIHIGSGPNQGHYVTAAKSDQQWVLLDDEEVTPIDESELAQYFGEPNIGTGYLFIYKTIDYSAKDILNQMMPNGWEGILSDACAKNGLDTNETAKYKGEDEGEALKKNTNPSKTLAPPHPRFDSKRPSLPAISTSIIEKMSPVANTSISASFNDIAEEKETSSWTSSWFKDKGKDKRKS